MFIESAKNPGWIEVICGSMFSGKTEELIRRLKRAKFANLRVEIFKPKIDTRYSEESVVSHQGNSILSTPVDSARSILEKSSASTRPSSSTRPLSTWPGNWLSAVSVSSPPAWTWTTWASLSVRCRP